jgi:hypothetical protein
VETRLDTRREGQAQSAIRVQGGRPLARRKGSAIQRFGSNRLPGKILGKAKLQSNLIVWLKTDQRRKATFGSRDQPATVGKRDDCDRPIAGLAELLWIDLCRLRKRERNGNERDAGKNYQPGKQRGEFHAGLLARLRYLMLDRHFENRIKQIENPIAPDGRTPSSRCLEKK